MKRLLLILSIVTAFWTAACSSGGSNVTPPPPTGNFSAANLNGQYAFVTSGEVFTPGSISATPLSRTGSFTADSQGHITGGVEDVNLAGTLNNAIPITGGSYTISADGRGTLNLSFGSNTLQFGITLTSTSTGDGLLIDETFTTNQASTGSGNFFKQNTASFAVSTVSGPYVFDFSGLDGTNAPESFIGEFTANNGVIGTGFFDDNVNGTFSNGAFIGTLAQDPLDPSSLSSFGRGIAVIASQNFVFYIADSNRVRFLSTNKGMLSGDAVMQSNNIPASVSSLSGGFVFVVAGSSGNGGLTRVGRFTANGASLTNVLMDTNNAGAFAQTNSATNTAVTLDPANPGRGTITFTANNFQVPLSFVFYLSSATQGVIQETTQSAQGVAAAVADGSIAAQSGSPFTSSNVTGTYAFNWSGLSIQNGGSFAVQDEEDLVGQASVSNLNLSGAADIFQFQSAVGPKTNLGVGGSITIRGDGTGGDGQRSTITVNLTGANPINFVVYFVNPQLTFFANTSTSSTRIVVGILKAQQ